MKRLLALFLALGLLAGVLPSADARYQDKDKTDKKDADKKDGKPKEDPKLTEAQKKDLEALTGTFTIVVFEREGKKESADALKTMKVVQQGAEWKFYLGEDITLGRDTLYPEKSPKEIDSYYINGPARDKIAKGIYKIEGDTITYVHADPGKDRPKEFSTKPDSGLTLIVMKRQPEAPKDGDKKDGEKKDK
ncbi:MAG: TIGR03067 domain-containing protein [Gemmataceae bacterium]